MSLNLFVNVLFREHDKYFDHLNHHRNGSRIIEIPEHIRRAYKESTGDDIPSKYMKKRNILSDTGNHVRKFVGKPLKGQNNLVRKSTFVFNFAQSYYDKEGMKDTRKASMS